MEKKKILLVAGIANLVIWVGLIINIIVLYPLSSLNAWIYGLILMLCGLCTFIIGLFYSGNIILEYIGSGITDVGELFIIWFLMQGHQFWFSIYLIPPIFTFFLMMIVAYTRYSEKLEYRSMMQISLMVFTGSLFVCMIEAAIRVPTFFQTKGIPIWAIVVIVLGLLLYIFTTWKFLDKPSYLIALAGAFLMNIGIFMLEVYFQFYEKTRIFMLNFIIPLGIFFILLYINYKISPNE